MKTNFKIAVSYRMHPLLMMIRGLFTVFALWPKMETKKRLLF